MRRARGSAGIATLRGLQQAARHVPKVEFYDEVVPFNPALRRTQGYYEPVWKVPHGDGTAGQHLSSGRLMAAFKWVEDRDDGRVCLRALGLVCIGSA